MLDVRKIRLTLELRELGIFDAKVLSAIERVPIEIFVPINFRNQAYENIALPIGNNQTISQPFIVALMTQSLELKKKGHNCIFFLDEPHSLINIEFKKFYIYRKDKKYLNESQDAKLFCKLTNSMGKGVVLLDDYRFSKIWEKHTSKFHKKNNKNCH